MKSEKRNGFIDIHSHFLPFLDDGAESYDHCVDSARYYLSAGIEQVIATPHYIPGTKWAPTIEQILNSIKQTEKILEEQDIPLTIHPGMEIMLTDQVCNNFDPDQYLSLGDKGYYLIEFPFNSQLNSSLSRGIQRLQSLEGIRFVIAHPERCEIFNTNNNWLELLVDKGIFTQVNIDSILGLAGKKIQQRAFEFLDAGLVHFLASDNHAKEGRMPPHHKKIDQLYDLIGKETTNHALKLNPMKLLEGKKVTPLINDGTINFPAQLYARQGGYMRKLKNLFIHN